jgi:hypothetical protein
LREAACDDNRARVLLPGAGDHEEDRRGHRDEGGHADAVEMHPHRRHEHHLAEEPEQDDRHGRTAGDDGKRGRERPPQHQSVIGLVRLLLKR